VDLERAALERGVIARISPAAVRAAAMAVTMDPNNATMHEAVARLYLHAGWLPAARRAVDRAIHLRPAQWRPWQLSGDIFAASGTYVEAADAYRAASARAPERSAARAAARRLTALALVSARRYDDARNEVEAGLREHADDPDMLVVKGTVLEALGHATEAETAFRASLALDASNQGAQEGLARVSPQRR
jgi:tetratricopeptide (TPR) repeat protein